VAAALGIAGFAVIMALTAWQVAVLTGWVTTSAVMVAWVVIAVRSTTGADTARLARREDDSRAQADVLIVSAAVASLVAVAFGLAKAAGGHASAKAAMTALAVLSVALSWALVQATFMLRYARLYYSDTTGSTSTASPPPTIGTSPMWP
jgi:uncharacterized membrane protein